MQVKVYIERRVFDPRGRCIKYRRSLARSFLAHFLLLFNVFPRQATNSIEDITNTARTIGTAWSSSAYSFQADGLLGGVTKGIVAGTGTNAVDINDYALQTLIAHGIAADQLYYLASVFDALSIVGQTASWRFRRTMNNNSGASITVQEVGWYAVGWASSLLAYTFCLIRDRISGGDAIPNGGAYQVGYTISVTS